jgi:threonine/homoserine/homoserine lactone efflux protein
MTTFFIGVTAAGRYYESRMLLLGLALGVALGFVGSIPAAGPLLMLVIASGLRAQRGRALALAAGGALAESGWVLLAFWGLGRTFDRYQMAMPWFGLASGCLLIGLGVALFASRRKPQRGAVAPALGFATGFGLVAFNPAFAVTWSAVAAALLSTRWLAPLRSNAVGIAVGSFVGILLWFGMIAKLAENSRGRFRPESLDRAVRGLGAAVALIGVWLVVRRFLG